MEMWDTDSTNDTTGGGSAAAASTTEELREQLTEMHRLLRQLNRAAGEEGSSLGVLAQVDYKRMQLEGKLEEKIEDLRSEMLQILRQNKEAWLRSVDGRINETQTKQKALEQHVEQLGRAENSIAGGLAKDLVKKDAEARNWEKLVDELTCRISDSTDKPEEWEAFREILAELQRQHAYIHTERTGTERRALVVAKSSSSSCEDEDPDPLAAMLLTHTISEHDGYQERCRKLGNIQEVFTWNAVPVDRWVPLVARWCLTVALKKATAHVTTYDVLLVFLLGAYTAASRRLLFLELRESDYDFSAG